MASEAGAVQKLPKPELRGYLTAYIKKQVFLGFVFASICGTSVW